MTQFVVERTFPEPLTQAELEQIDRRITPCLDMHRVRYVRSYWSRDHRRMICLYEAPDAESVREVQREARAPFDDVWPATILGETAAP